MEALGLALQAILDALRITIDVLAQVGSVNDIIEALKVSLEGIVDALKASL